MGLLDAWRTTRQNIIDSKPTYSRIFPAQDYSAGVYRGNTNNPVVASDSTGNIVEQPAPITRRIIDNGGRGGDFDDNNTSFVDNDVFQALAQTGAGVRGEDYDRPTDFYQNPNFKADFDKNEANFDARHNGKAEFMDRFNRNEANFNKDFYGLNEDLNVLTGKEMSDATQNPDNNSFSLGKAGDLATNVGDFALNAIKGGPMGTAYTMATNDAFPREALPAAAALAMAPMVIPGAGILGTIGGALNNAGAYHDFGNDPNINSAGGEISYQNGLMSAPTDAPGGYVYQDGEKSNINSLAAMDPNTPINVGGGEYSSAGDLYQGLSQTGAGVEGEDYNRPESFGDSDSDGGGDSGGTVICTELHRQKLLLDNVYDVDREVGLYFEKNDPLVVKGYHFWAVPLARLMSKSKIVTALVKPIALPWANQMYAQKHNLKANLIGKLMLLIGVPFCRFLGSLLTKIEKVTPNDTRTRSA
tara:strand:+ start:9916 stop:11331 length:1416 start_codon:yes stop_codon:yes gene_type:complete